MTKHNRRAVGFTLVEVLVALVILGLGIASILIAYSSSLNLMRKARDRTVAALLARSKLEETIASNNTDVLGDSSEETYNGVPYAYRITSTPLPLVNKTVAEHFKSLPRVEEIRVEVFWGEAGQQQRYVLVSYRRVAPPPEAAGTGSNATPNNPSANPTPNPTPNPNPFPTS